MIFAAAGWLSVTNMPSQHEPVSPTLQAQVRWMPCACFRGLNIVQE